MFGMDGKVKGRKKKRVAKLLFCPSVFVINNSNLKFARV